MPQVTNNASSARGFLFKGPPDKRGMASPGMFERVMIAPGETVDVDPKFLESKGAKAMIASGDVSVESGGRQPVSSGDDEEPSKPAEAEAKASKPAKQAASKKAAGRK